MTPRKSANRCDGRFNFHAYFTDFTGESAAADIVIGHRNAGIATEIESLAEASGTQDGAVAPARADFAVVDKNAHRATTAQAGVIADEFIDDRGRAWRQCFAGADAELVLCFLRHRFEHSRTTVLQIKTPAAKPAAAGHQHSSLIRFGDIEVRGQLERTQAQGWRGIESHADILAPVTVAVAVLALGDGAVDTARKSETIVERINIVLPGLAVEHCLHLGEFLRLAGGEVLGLTEIGAQVIQFPLIAGVRATGKTFVLPRHTTRFGICPPAVVIDAAVGRDLEILRAMRLRRLGIGKGRQQADAIQRLLRNAVDRGRRGYSRRIENGRQYIVDV